MAHTDRECVCDNPAHPRDVHDCSGGWVQVPPFTAAESVARTRDACRAIYTIMGMVPEGTHMVTVTFHPYSGDIVLHFGRREDAEALARKLGLPVSQMSTPNQGHSWWVGMWGSWPIQTTTYDPKSDRRKEIRP